MDAYLSRSRKRELFESKKVVDDVQTRLLKVNRTLRESYNADSYYDGQLDV